MKKIILFAAVLLSVGTTMTSCKKDYKCECSKTYTNNNGTTTRDYSIYTYNDSRKRAEDRCNENASSGSDFGGPYSINCAIQ